jgi:hypothetical protein
MWRSFLLVPVFLLLGTRAEAAPLAEGAPSPSLSYAFSFLCLLVVLVIICMPSRKA